MLHRPTVEEGLFQLKLTTVVLADADFAERLKQVPVYLFAQTSDNEASVLKRGAELFKKGIASEVIISDDTEGTNKGYPGSKVWKQELKKLRIPAAKITVIPCKGLLHTLSESQALVSYCKRQRNVIVVTPPFHQVRAFISMVSAIGNGFVPTLRVYNRTGVSMPWLAEACHSQGTLKTTRLQLVETELERILTYQDKDYTDPGRLSGYRTVFGYLKWRDQA